MKLPDIDFRNLRKHRNSLNDGFEELTRQLVLADPPDGYTSIENRGPGADGGVEILVRFANDLVWGWQSKFFDSGFDASEVSQLKKSFRAALANYPGLERYYVAIPRNLSGSDEGANSTQRSKWRKYVSWARDEATKVGRKVQIELWDDSEFVRKLQSNDPVYVGIRSYWFDEEVLTQEWFADKFANTKERIGNRYLPEDHVDLDIRSIFDVLTRNSGLKGRLEALQSKIRDAKANCEKLRGHADKDINTPAQTLHNDLEALEKQTHVTVCTPESSLGELADMLVRLKEIGRGNDNLSALRAAEYERASDEDIAESRERSDWKYDSYARYSINELVSCVATAGNLFSETEISLLENQYLLVLGEAGSGKSHLLADEISRHLKEGQAGLFVPARALQHAGQPGQSILEFLDCADLRFETWLGALSAAAYAANGYALIALDGINESIGAADWESSLPELMQQVSHFPNIKIIVSCRTVFQKLCIRDDLAITKIHHPGFRGSLSKAAKLFLDNHGIERSSAPIFELSEVLNNPLFLTAVVRGLKREGRTSFPRELDSLPRILEYWLGSVERCLIDNKFDRITLGDGKLGRIVRALAAAMAEKGEEQLSFDEASELSEKIIGLAPPTKSHDQILLRLLEEGLLLDFPSDVSPSGKTVSFSFQKFGDYFIANSILRAASDAPALATSLLPGGKYAHIFDQAKRWYFEGIRIALLALCPARFGEELPFITPQFSKTVRVEVDDFLSSIPLRDQDALSERTVKILEKLRNPKKGSRQKPLEDREWYSLLTKLATSPGAVINADYLKRHLEGISRSERDATWSYYLVGSLEVYDDDDYSTPVHQLVDWAWNAPAQDVDLSQVRLAAITLSLMTSTMDRSVRDRATKALASLFIKYPSSISPTIDAFSNWDDSYVRERVLAAGLAGTLTCLDEALLTEIAKATDGMVFSKAPVERHAWTRRYGELIIEHVNRHSTQLDTSIVDRSRPPYQSAPIQSWPSLRDIAEYREKASSIVSSVVGYLSEPIEETSPGMAGDFGRYTMGGIDNHFSFQPRTSKAPRTRREDIEAFFDEIRASSGKIGSRLDKLISADQAWHGADDSSFRGFLASLSDDEPEELVKESDAENAVAALKKEFQRLEEQFLDDLPTELTSRFEKMQPFQRYQLDEVPRFSLSKAQCWVVERCIELGWSPDLHKKIERGGLNYSYDRYDHHVERIGKKYQHIAFQELIGYLADYHWYVEYDEPPVVLLRLERFQRPDIDPTFLAGLFSRPSEGYDPGSLSRPKLHFEPEGLAKNIAWAKTTEDLPDIPSLLVQRGEDGRDWCIVYSFTRNKDYMKNFESADPMRNGQLGIEMVLVPSVHLDALDKLDWQTMKDSKHDVFWHGWSSEEFFGQRSASNLEEKKVPFEAPFVIGEIPFARIYDLHSVKYSEYDHSGVSEESGFFTPKSALLCDLKLRPKNAYSRLFVDEADRAAFVDEPGMLDQWCVMRFDLIEEFAKRQNMTMVWRVWFEKDGGLGSKVRDSSQETFVRKDYLGYLRNKDGEWRGELIPFRD